MQGFLVELLIVVIQLVIFGLANVYFNRINCIVSISNIVKIKNSIFEFD